MMNITPTVKQLLIINIIFYIGSQVLGEQAYQLFSLYFVENDNFQIWQPLTHMFMHAQMPNIMHILFNMFALYSFGSALESFWGAKKFLFFYISCGLGAALLHLGVNYYEFHSGLDSLMNAGFSKTDIFSLLNEGKIDTRWQDVLGNAGVKNGKFIRCTSRWSFWSDLRFTSCLCLYVSKCATWSNVYTNPY